MSENRRSKRVVDHLSSKRQTSRKHIVKSDEHEQYESDFIDDESASDWDDYASLGEQYRNLKEKHDELRIKYRSLLKGQQQSELTKPSQRSECGAHISEQQQIPECRSADARDRNANWVCSELSREFARTINLNDESRTKTDQPIVGDGNLQPSLEGQQYRELPASVQRAVSKSWPTRQACYTQVKVLLVCWASDDMVPKLHTELDALDEVFSKLYHYDVSRFDIPDHNPLQSLSDRVDLFIGDDSSKILLIFFYAGHGGLNPGPNDLTWSATRKSGPIMSSQPIQAKFEDSRSDAVQFYHACRSAETAVTAQTKARRGVTELIAACGFKEGAPGVGPHSFSASLINALKSGAQTGAPFSVSTLFSRVFSSLKKSENYMLKATPVHTRLVCDRTGRQIKLQPLRQQQAIEKKSNVEVDNEAKTLPVGLPFGLFFKTSRHIETQDWKDWIIAAPADALEVCFRHTASEEVNDCDACTSGDEDECGSITTTEPSSEQECLEPSDDCSGKIGT